MAFNPNVYRISSSSSRFIPVILLLDVSGSMRGEKILRLQEAVKNMIDELSSQAAKEVPIHAAVISFGSVVKIHTELTPVNILHEKGISDLEVYGETRLAQALDLAKSLIEDRDELPSKVYRPTVVLVSDGRPNLGWEPAMLRFTEEGRSQKCQRFAIAIGNDANKDILRQFAGGIDNVLYAENAASIAENMQLITMTVTARSRAADPNAGVAPVSIRLNSINTGKVVDTDDECDDF